MTNLDRRKFLGATALGGAALIMKNTKKISAQTDSDYF